MSNGKHILLRLVEIKNYLEDIEIICDKGRVINEHGETWQDIAYNKSLRTRKIIEEIFAELLEESLRSIMKNEKP